MVSLGHLGHGGPELSILSLISLKLTRVALSSVAQGPPGSSLVTGKDSVLCSYRAGVPLSG